MMWKIFWCTFVFERHMIMWPKLGPLHKIEFEKWSDIWNFNPFKPYWLILENSSNVFEIAVFEWLCPISGKLTHFWKLAWTNFLWMNFPSIGVSNQPENGNLKKWTIFPIYVNKSWVDQKPNLYISNVKNLKLRSGSKANFWLNDNVSFKN